MTFFFTSSNEAKIAKAKRGVKEKTKLREFLLLFLGC